MLAPFVAKLALYDVKMIGIVSQSCTYYKSKYDERKKGNCLNFKSQKLYHYETTSIEFFWKR